MCLWKNDYFTHCNHQPLYLQTICTRRTFVNDPKSSKSFVRACNVFHIASVQFINDACSDCRPSESESRLANSSLFHTLSTSRPSSRPTTAYSPILPPFTSTPPFSAPPSRHSSCTPSIRDASLEIRSAGLTRESTFDLNPRPPIFSRQSSIIYASRQPSFEVRPIPSRKNSYHDGYSASVLVTGNRERLILDDAMMKRMFDSAGRRSLEYGRRPGGIRERRYEGDHIDAFEEDCNAFLMSERHMGSNSAGRQRSGGGFSSFSRNSGFAQDRPVFERSISSPKQEFFSASFGRSTLKPEFNPTKIGRVGTPKVERNRDYYEKVAIDAGSLGKKFYGLYGVESGSSSRSYHERVAGSPTPSKMMSERNQGCKRDRTAFERQITAGIGRGKRAV